MLANEDNRMEFTKHPIDFILVGVPEPLKGLEVVISDYTVPEDSGGKFRGVANIRFPNSEEILNDENKNTKIVVQAYVTKSEFVKGYNRIFAVKEKGEFNLDEIIVHAERDKIGGGYIEGKMKVGDPPIAVG